jgi:hypothetical protein
MHVARDKEQPVGHGGILRLRSVEVGRLGEAYQLVPAAVFEWESRSLVTKYAPTSADSE